MIEINKVYCESNIETMARMPDGFVNLTVTSPPYDDMDTELNSLPKRGLRQYKGYTWDFKAIAHELYRVTKDGGVVVWVVGDPTIDGSESLASSLQKVYFRKVGFNIHDTMIYEKAGFSFPDSSRYNPIFEYIFVLSKSSPSSWNPICDKPNKYAGSKVARNRSDRQSNGKIIPNSAFFIAPNRTVKEKGKRDNIWRYSIGGGHTTKDGDTTHPAAFPEFLAQDIILSWSNPGDLIFDPFMGSGTVAKMAIINNRNFIGSEIAPEYAPIYEKRIADALAQMSKAPRIVESGNTKYSIPPLFAE